MGVAQNHVTWDAAGGWGAVLIRAQSRFALGPLGGKKTHLITVGSALFQKNFSTKLLRDSADVRLSKEASAASRAKALG